MDIIKNGTVWKSFDASWQNTNWGTLQAQMEARGRWLTKIIEKMKIFWQFKILTSLCPPDKIVLEARCKSQMEARADNWQNESQVIPWRRCRRKSRFWKNAPARKFINIPKIGGNCKTWKTISTSSVCLWRYLPSKAKANVWGQNLNCCDLLVSANFPWLCIVRRAKKKKVLFATQLADFPTFSSSAGGYCFLFVKN